MDVVFDLSGLPSQLLRHIAVRSHEVDIPHLRATCRELRAATDDPSFREDFTVVLTPSHLSSSSLVRIMRSRLTQAITCLDIRSLDAKLAFIPTPGFQLPHLQRLLFHIQHRGFAVKLGTASPKLTRVTVAGAPEDNQTQALLSFPHMTSLHVNAGALRRSDVFKQLGRQLAHLDLHGSWIQTASQRFSLVLLTQLTGLVGLSITKEALAAVAAPGAASLQLPGRLLHVEGQSGSFALLPALPSYPLAHLTSLSFWLPLPTPGAPTSLAPLGCLAALQALTLISPIASEIQVRMTDLAPLAACSRLTSLTADVLLVPSEGNEAEPGAAAAAASAGGGGAAAAAGGGGVQGTVTGSNNSSSSMGQGSSGPAPLAFHSNSSSSSRSVAALPSLRRLDVGHLGYLRSDFPLSTPFPNVTHLVWSEFEDLGDPSPPFNEQVDLLSGLTGLRQLDTNMACMLRLLRNGSALVNGALTGLGAVRLETVLPEGVEELFPALPLLPGLTQLELYTWERHTSAWEAGYRQEEDLNLWHRQIHLRSLKLRASHIVGGLFSPGISAPHLLTTCLPQLSELVFEDCEALTADLLNQLLLGLSMARAAAEVAASSAEVAPGAASSSSGGGGAGDACSAPGVNWSYGAPAAAAAAGGGGGGGGGGASSAVAAVAAAASPRGGLVLAPLCVRVTGTHQLGDEARGRLIRQLSEEMTEASHLPSPVGEHPQQLPTAAAAAAADVDMPLAAQEAAAAAAAAAQEAAAAVQANCVLLPQQHAGEGAPAAGASQQQQQQQVPSPQRHSPQRHSPTRVRGELAVVGLPLTAAQQHPAPTGGGVAGSSQQPHAATQQAGGPFQQQQQQQGPVSPQQQAQPLCSPQPPLDARTPSPQQELLLQQLRRHMRLLDEGRGVAAAQQQQAAWRSQQGSPDQPPSKRHHPQQHLHQAVTQAAPAGPGAAAAAAASVSAAAQPLVGCEVWQGPSSSTAGAPTAAVDADSAHTAAADSALGGAGVPVGGPLGVAALCDRYFEGFYVIRPGLWLEVGPPVLGWRAGPAGRSEQLLGQRGGSGAE